MKLLFAEKPTVHTVPSGGQKTSCCLFRVNRSKCRLVGLNNFPPLRLEGEECSRSHCVPVAFCVDKFIS